MSRYKTGDLVETLVMSKRRGSKYWLPATIQKQLANQSYNLEIVKDVAEHYMVVKDRKSVHKEKIRPLPDLHVGDRVRVDQNKNGYIRWIGCHKVFGNSVQVRYGIELDTARGFSDGTWKKVRFFQCNRWCGVFLKERERIKLIKSVNQPNSSSTLVKKSAVPQSASGKIALSTVSVAKEAQVAAQDDEKKATYLSPRLHTEEEKEIRQTFKFFDTNKDRKIDAKELKSVMKQLGSEIDDYGVQLLLNDFDLSKNGAIEWADFLKMMKQIGGLVT